MNARPLIFLTAAVIVLAGIVMFVNRPGAPVGGGANQLFAPELAALLDDVTTIRIVGPGNTTVASLRRTDADWVVEERDGYPANTNVIRSALTQLSRASTIEAKTARPEDFHLLGVEDLADADAGGIGLEFLPASLELPGIVLGDTSGSSYRFARLMNSNQSWLINADPEVPDTTAQWLAADILSVDGSRVERILIEHADGETLDISKASPEQANFEVAEIPAGRSLQYPGVANVLGNVLRNLRLEDVAAFDPQALTPEVTTQFLTFDGLLVTARGYAIDDAGWLVFSASVDDELSNPSDAVEAEAEAINAHTNGWRYRIPEYQYSQIARRIDDLLSAADTD